MIVAARRLDEGHRTPENRFARLWLGVSLVPVLLTNTPSPTSFLPLLPPLLIVAAPPLVNILRSSRRLVVAAILAPVLILAFFQWARPKFESLLALKRIDITQAAAAVRHLTRSDDPIVALGPDAERLYVAAKRRPASWHIHADRLRLSEGGHREITHVIDRLRVRVVVELGDTLIRTFPDVGKGFERHYRLAETGHDYRIYARQ